ncbi:hypothetical protein M378DRAFT_126775 [Amanita muscaria Koide BX008]|uniref:Protein YAE1 n=1 Tax=Amanita muscaria (strain Koide BX008) TaxID=946122 RepID=A0A0C2X516_AMAMK|nr:hypothetical protein M378DRAFT_126775 [Amanita muscaria Koide BX008]
MDFDSPWEDEAADLTLARENEWSKLASDFTNAGYREGINAGKEAALQEGFDAGFAQVGAPLGRELGVLRGIASALVGFLSSSKAPSSSLIEARDIAAQLSKVRFSDIAPPDLEAEAHAREHLANEDDAAEVDVPEEVVEKQKMERLEDMLEGMSASSDGTRIARPTVDDVRILKERLYALCSSIGFGSLPCSM